MKLRSIKLTNFHEAGSLVVPDVPDGGVAQIAEGDPALIGDALRFAFTGQSADNGSVIADGTGFAFVDVGFQLADDGRVSVFRGVDGRGTVQATLREAGGQRVTRGTEEVHTRLTEILRGDPAVLLAALWPDEPLRDPRYDELMDLGRRLRRERATVGADVDALAAEEQVEPQRPAGTETGMVAPWAIAALASVLVTGLVIVSVGSDRGSPSGAELALGVAALAAVAGSLTLTARRLIKERDAVAAPAQSALDLRARLHQRLAELDETIAVFTVEAGRASRALRLPMPGRRSGEVGLSPNEPLDELRDRIRGLADALHATHVGA